MNPGVLVAGIGNIFLGDDGFGCAVARRLAELALPEGVRIVDFGIRGMDLVYAMLEQHDAVILVDIVRRGGAPGTLYLIEPHLDPETPVTLDTHGMDPVKVLSLARALGARPVPTFLVGCEPAVVLDGDSPDVLAELSEPVQAALDEAARLVLSTLERIDSPAAASGAQRSV